VTWSTGDSQSSVVTGGLLFVVTPPWRKRPLARPSDRDPASRRAQGFSGVTAQREDGHRSINVDAGPMRDVGSVITRRRYATYRRRRTRCNPEPRLGT